MRRRGRVSKADDDRLKAMSDEVDSLVSAIKAEAAEVMDNDCYPAPFAHAS
jgi:hypothetical protein